MEREEFRARTRFPQLAAHHADARRLGHQTSRGRSAIRQLATRLSLAALVLSWAPRDGVLAQTAFNRSGLAAPHDVWSVLKHEHADPALGSSLTATLRLPWTRLHVQLRSVGRFERFVDAYRGAITQRPRLPRGDVWESDLVC